MISNSFRDRNIEPLKPREIEIAIARELDMTIAEIADWLGLAPSTVRNYMNSARQKCGVKRTEAVYFLAREVYGMISDQDIEDVINSLRDGGFLS
ncbi:MAG TPA: helix-turn-helix transcriptional regulator [Chloroflexia bacterium]